MSAQYVSVDQIVINYSLGIDPDDYGTNVSDIMMRQYALLGAREIGFDVAQRIKSVKLTIDQALGTAELPMDLGIQPNNQNNQFLADLDSYVFQNYMTTGSLGRMYGLGGGQGAGQYRMNLAENRIEVAQDNNVDNVVIEYIADEAKSDCPLVPVFAEQAVKAYMYYNIIQRKTSVPANEKARARSEYYSERRLANSRMKSWSKDQALQVIRQNFKLSPKA